MKDLMQRFVAALQFLTTLPVPARSQFHRDDLVRSVPFFPLIGLLIAAGGLGVRFVLVRHVSRSVIVVLILAYLVVITGGLHEDALGDAADGFGGGWNKEQVLAIMHDSRIGTYGAIAISLSLLARFVFLTELAPEKFIGYFVAGQVLSRWTSLPLSFFLPPARPGTGQGHQLAGRISRVSLITGSLLTAAIAGAVLEYAVIWAGLTVLVVTVVSSVYYRGRIGGITGDCLGATIQLAEIGVYLTGVVIH